MSQTFNNLHHPFVKKWKHKHMFLQTNSAQNVLLFSRGEDNKYKQYNFLAESEIVHLAVTQGRYHLYIYIYQIQVIYPSLSPSQPFSLVPS